MSDTGTYTREEIRKMFELANQQEFLQKYFDELNAKYQDSPMYDHKRHYDDEQVKIDVNDLISSYLLWKKHSSDTDKNRKKWVENLSEKICFLRDNQKYKVCDGIRVYSYHYFGYDGYSEETCDMYIDVLRNYHKNIGCDWENG